MLYFLQASVAQLVRASVYQTEGPEFNPRWGHKSFETFLNFYLLDNVSAEGKSWFSYIMGIISCAIMKLLKNPLPPMMSWFDNKKNYFTCPTFIFSSPIISLYIKIGCSSKCSPHWEHLEKWLIQFWNPLLMADVIGYVPFPEFFSIGNNYKYCSISGVFSVLGAPRKVIDTVLESSTHGDQS